MLFQDILSISTVLVSDEIFSARLSSLATLHLTEKTHVEKEKVFSETRAWLLSLGGISEKIYNKYYVEYPDIVSPVLMAMAQVRVQLNFTDVI